mgnify:CR=1 FL=1
MNNTKLYSQIVQDLSEEIGISIEDTKSLTNVALSSIDIKKINYEKHEMDLLWFWCIYWVHVWHRY